MHAKIHKIFLTLILASLFLTFAVTNSIGATQAGVVTTNIGMHALASDVALQPDGKIVVAGRASNASNDSNDDFAVVRYNSDGSLDTTFSGDGVATTDIGSGYDWGWCVALQPDGKIVVAGSSNFDFAIVRYNSDGSLDTTFSGTGIVTTNFGGSSVGFDIALQPDGKIVVAGTSWNSQYSYFFALARYNNNGSLDTTFSGDGLVTTQIGFEDDSGYGVVVQPDGKIVVAGESWYGDGYSFALARYNNNGSLDASFSGAGKLTTDIGIDSSSYSVALQPDGKIVVAGDSDSGINYDFAIARYNSDGYLDTTFSGNGIVTTPIGSGNDWGSSVALQSNGKIVVVGDTEKSSGTFGYDFAVVRYNSDGSLDTTFSNDGKLTTAIGIDATAVSVASQPDGKIVVVGVSNNGSNDAFAVARYNTDGSLDDSFSPLPLLAGSPGSLVVPSADADGNYTVSWGASSTAGVTYILEEATNPSFTGGLQTVSTTDTTVTITDRPLNATYYYRVKATKAGYQDSAYYEGTNGCAVPGTLVSAVPASLTVPSADADGNYTVSWGASATAGVSYVLQEATDPAFTTNLRQAYSGPNLSTNVTGVQGVTYYYRVKATKAGYTDSTWRLGSRGCAVPGTVQAAVPTELTVPQADADGSYTITWKGPLPAGGLFVLDEATDPTFTTDLKVVYSGTGRTTTLSGRDQGVTYYYRVRAVKAGQKDSRFRIGIRGCAVPGTEVLRAPATVTVPTTDADGSYPVSWEQVNTPGVVYLLEEATSTDFRAGLRTAYYGTALSKQITGRSAGATYYYRVKTVKPGAVDSARRTASNGCLVGP